VRQQDPIREAIDAGTIGSRLWFYTNYHCNLACSYCLTGSSPRSARRLLDPDRILGIAADAPALGFEAFGVTGGEPLLVPGVPAMVGRLADIAPVTLLTNGTLFTPRMLRRFAPFAGRHVAVQISLDSADPAVNDAARGPGNHARVVDAVPRLVAMGVRVRIATTLEADADDELPALCALHRSLGVPDTDHVVRQIVARGRAIETGLGVEAGEAELFPELTLTADGAFWSPFGPTTIAGGGIDATLRVCEKIEPLGVPAGELAGRVARRATGADALLGVR
jgi:MoaA/NifB/PqqE/SkfB family radical SAM enzyme